MTIPDQTLAVEPKCADCSHGTLAHNAIGGACTKCDCGHFRPKAAPASEEAAPEYEVTWGDGSIYSNRFNQTRLTEEEARMTAPRIGGTWRRATTETQKEA